MPEQFFRKDIFLVIKDKFQRVRTVILGSRSLGKFQQQEKWSLIKFS